MIRLDSFICHETMLTRKQAKIAIRSGRVQIGNRIIREADSKIDETTDEVFLDGNQLFYTKNRYYYMDKPIGYITATEDKMEKTVLELFPAEIRQFGIFPVGRLDKDTSGLLLFTNDGDFAHKIISPHSQVPKRYIAQLSRTLSQEDIASFEKGIQLSDGTQCKPAILNIVSENTGEVTLCEGKYHQVRRMFAATGNSVVTLRRVAIGKLNLSDELGPGGFREIPYNHLCTLFNDSSSE